ncbi:hypothetical protein SLS61_010263, partial [Didymella pomorum]
MHKQSWTYAHHVCRKSQIAIEYAYRAREAAPHLWVFWVYASNVARFEQAYREITARLELPGRDDPKTDILLLVRNWLCDERNGRWLMIVDNADDDRVFAAPGATDVSGGTAQTLEPFTEAGTAAPLASFLPQPAHGWILVTSRDRVAAMNLVGARRNVVEVQPMGEQDALTLLKSKTQVDELSEGDARALVKTLEGIPLAVTHAAAYIDVYWPAIDLSAYLQMFRESEANQASLLNSGDARDLRRDASVSSAVITTWQLSFEQIRKMRPEAADLLSLMTMFDRQGIPEHILYEGRSKLQFAEAVGPLLCFSLVRAQTKEQSEGRLQEQLFEMHSLVQLATTEWVKMHGQMAVWQKASLRIMAAVLPSGEHETWEACRALLPHSTKVLGYDMEWDNKARLDLVTIAINTTWYLELMGDYREAGQVGRRAVVASEVLGREHPDALTSISQLGSVLVSQGKYDEAEVMHRQALEGREKALGQKHLSTLISANNLGLVLERQGKYEEAEAMHRRALKGNEKMLGLEHRETLISVSHIGSVLSRQCKYEEAEAMFRRALQGLQNMLGPEHPDTFASVSNLGWMLSRQSKYKEAEAMHQRALEGREKALGPEHPHTLNSASQLGTVLERQGKYDEAVAMHRRALEGREEVLGDDHPDTLTAMANLASTLRSQGRSQEALSLMDACVRLRAKTLGL